VVVQRAVRTGQHRGLHGERLVSTAHLMGWLREQEERNGAE
jgi:hypothetical protein